MLWKSAGKVSESQKEHWTLSQKVLVVSLGDLGQIITPPPTPVALQSLSVQHEGRAGGCLKAQVGRQPSLLLPVGCGLRLGWRLVCRLQKLPTHTAVC